MWELGADERKAWDYKEATASAVQRQKIWTMYSHTIEWRTRPPGSTRDKMWELGADERKAWDYKEATASAVQRQKIWTMYSHTIEWRTRPPGSTEVKFELD
ncbi:hypothetical protein B0H14DRAFT_2602504 [Mycena olivaceomarginata]|nr:hypothetical protein B0H14DRAFT_2602504 [Mycena olivaceomarginata]